MTDILTHVYPPEKIYVHLYQNLWADSIVWSRRGNNMGSRSMRVSVQPVKHAHANYYPDDIRNHYHNDHDEKDYIMDFIEEKWAACLSKVPDLAEEDTWFCDHYSMESIRGYLYKAFLNYCRKRARREKKKAAKHIQIEKLTEEQEPMINNKPYEWDHILRAIALVRANSTPEELVILDWRLGEITKQEALRLLGITSERTLTHKKNAAYKRWTSLVS